VRVHVITVGGQVTSSFINVSAEFPKLLRTSGQELEPAHPLGTTGTGTVSTRAHHHGALQSAYVSRLLMSLALKGAESRASSSMTRAKRSLLRALSSMTFSSMVSVATSR